MGYASEGSAPIGLHYSGPRDVGDLVAVASSGTVSRAAWSDDDGTTWNLAASSPLLQWQGIAYSSTLKRYVAVANSGGPNNIMTSDDGGRTWTIRAAPVSLTLKGVAWNGLLFSALADGVGANRVITSTDGITWVQGTCPQQTVLTRVVWAGGMGSFLSAGGPGGTSGMSISPNGSAWAVGALDTGLSATYTAVTFDGSAVCSISDRIFSSADAGQASPWVQRASPGLALLDLTYASSLGLLVGIQTSSVIRTSGDQVNWATPASPGAQIVSSVVWSPSRRRFYITTTSNAVWSSADGATWISTPISSRQWRGIATGEAP
jgi:hypothetical protein